MLFWQYYRDWIEMYKEGAIAKVTLAKYHMSLKKIKEIVPDLQIQDMNRMTYQRILNEYAKTHEKQTTMDFHHQIKAAALDAVDEGLIERDPTRRVVIKGKAPRPKKIKYLSKNELQLLVNDLAINEYELNWDWLIFLVSKTGLRFAEALGVTPKDFDFRKQELTINKTWNYKDNSGFAPTKNKSSMRKIIIDWQLSAKFSALFNELNLPPGRPVFVQENKKIYNSTINDLLERHCTELKIPVISIHGLRHTHASVLFQEEVPIISISNRLGHSSVVTTQKIYLHLIRELENTANDKIMRCMSQIV